MTLLLQIFFANLEHHRANGPLFIYVKDIGDYTTRWLSEGLMLDIARDVGGALFTFDHRYFGANIPVE